MKSTKFTAFCLAVAFTAAPVSSVTAQSAVLDVDAHADRILREMGDYLRTAGEYTFRADINYDDVVDDQMIQFGSVVQIALQRSPDRLNVELDGDELQRRVVFDGKTITVHNLSRNVYATTETPPDVGLALDHLFEVFGSSVPIADLVYDDPYRTLIENAQTGYVVGQHPVGGIQCHHLAFAQESIDWQIWIEVGPRPIPRKLIITYRDEPGSPQHISELSEWNFTPRLSEHYFTFRPPEGADEVDFLPPQEPEEEQP
jgi:hypothetical protein